MRRVALAIINLVAALCFLLAVSIAVAWGARFRVLFGWPNAPVAHIRPTLGTDPIHWTLNVGILLPLAVRPRDLLVRRFGFGYADTLCTGGGPHGTEDIGTYRGVEIPYWAVIVASLLLPATQCYLIVRGKRLVREGLCPICGYDLRATPERCLECGTIPAAAPPHP